MNDLSMKVKKMKFKEHSTLEVLNPFSFVIFGTFDYREDLEY